MRSLCSRYWKYLVLKSWILLLTLVSFNAHSDSLSDDELLAESPQKETEDNKGDNSQLDKFIRDQPHEIVFVPIPAEDLDAMISGKKKETDTYDVRSYELSKEDTQVNQRWMMIGTWVMAVLMLGTVILLTWNAILLRKANRFGRSMANTGQIAANASIRAANTAQATLTASNAAADAAWAAVRETERGQRAYLAFQDPEVIPYNNGNAVRVELTFINYGKTPAFKVATGSGYFVDYNTDQLISRPIDAPIAINSYFLETGDRSIEISPSQGFKVPVNINERNIQRHIETNFKVITVAVRLSYAIHTHARDDAPIISDFIFRLRRLEKVNSQGSTEISYMAEHRSEKIAGVNQGSDDPQYNERWIPPDMRC